MIIQIFLLLPENNVRNRKNIIGKIIIDIEIYNNHVIRIVISMKVIRIIAIIMLIIGLAFPVAYNKIILPSLNEQQINFQTLVDGMELKIESSITFDKMIRTKSVFEFLYDYDNKKYTKLDIKNLLFCKLDKKGWKSKGSGIRPGDIWTLNMENESYFCYITIYDESFSMAFSYKGLYD